MIYKENSRKFWFKIKDCFLTRKSYLIILGIPYNLLLTTVSFYFPNCGWKKTFYKHVKN